MGLQRSRHFSDGADGCGLAMVWWHIVLALVFCGIGRTSCKPSSGHDWRDHVAGGLAGGLTTALLYPIDTVKTILQTNPNVHSIREALAFARTEGLGSSGVYSGLMPTVMGAIPSSSLYFGTYELAKKSLRSKLGARHSHWINVLAAASGNVVSSVLLVPKETIKLQLQAFSTGAVARPAAFPLTSAGISRYIYRRYGIRGFFPSYHATLLRNIPSTAVSVALACPLRTVSTLLGRLLPEGAAITSATAFVPCLSLLLSRFGS